jgi:uncharacterized protein (DUF4415 family)
MKKENSSQKLTAEQKKQIAALAALPDEAIDTSDIPEILDWSNAKRGVFYRPIKQQITLRIDADLIAWFKSKVPEKKGYQTTINSALREYVVTHAAE